VIALPRRSARRLLIPLLLATSLNIAPTHAVGATAPPGIQPPFTGATALTSSPQAGSSDNSKVDTWVFKGTAGHNVHLVITTTGDKSFAPTLYVFTPSGVLVSGGSCSSCELGVNVTESGNWSVAASKADDDGLTGSYTLSVTDAN
jgi:hypothetical protein